MNSTRPRLSTTVSGGSAANRCNTAIDVLGLDEVELPGQDDVRSSMVLNDGHMSLQQQRQLVHGSPSGSGRPHC